MDVGKKATEECPIGCLKPGFSNALPAFLAFLWYSANKSVQVTQTHKTMLTLRLEIS